ncbi:hypothetical protein [Streptosporangium sp. NPDC048865]|uniref:hypothetical protein n=1 Tax=Streptosporangium sp. NPDC048865 TaxID=3155766 RepID=UPI00341883FE
MGIALFIAAASGMALYLSRRELQEADQSASVISAFIGLAGLALAIYGTLADRPIGSTSRPMNDEETLAAAKKKLTDLVSQQWHTEATIRSLANPRPIPISWHLIDDASLMDHPHLVGEHLLTFNGSSDKVADLAHAFRRLHRRRLVITGGPGTGKTTLAIQLLLELVPDRDPADPVPVLVPVNGWDTSVHPRLQDWIATRLASDYPELNAREFGVDAAKTLVAHGHILPILDGMDEIPEPARAAVIFALNRWLAYGDQFILTSRTTEFAAALEQGGGVLRAAAVIAPAAITPAVAETHLRDCLPPVPRHDWTPVWSALRDGSCPHLSRLTETALGLWLISTVYTARDTDPTGLTDTARFPAYAALLAHLFDELIPTLIADRAPSDNPAEPFLPRHRHDPVKVRHWLTYLAHHLTCPSGSTDGEDGGQGTRDFAWWRLAATTGTMTFATQLALTVAATLLVASTLGLAFGLVDWAENTYLEEKDQYLGEFPLGIGGVVGGLVAGGYFGFNVRFWVQDRPGYADLRIRRRSAALIRRFMHWLTLGLMGGLGLLLTGSLEEGLPEAGIVTIFVWFGLATGPPRPACPVRPPRTGPAPGERVAARVPGRGAAAGRRRPRCAAAARRPGCRTRPAAR